MNNNDFEHEIQVAVDLHCLGKQQKALSILDRLLAIVDNDDQRSACLHEKYNVLWHLRVHHNVELRQLRTELTSVEARRKKSSKFKSWQQDRPAQTAI